MLLGIDETSHGRFYPDYLNFVSCVLILDTKNET